MGITDGKLLFCHGISEGSGEKKMLMKESNNRTLYDCFNNTFTDDCGSPDLNLPPITTDDKPRPNKRSHYTQDLIPDAIYVAYENSVSTLNNPSDSPQLLLQPSNNTNPSYAMKKDEPVKTYSAIGGDRWC